MIDTHAHIYLSDFNEDIDSIVARAKAAGVEKVLLPNIDVHSIRPMLELENKYPNFCYSMMGLHPCYVKEDFQKQLKVVKDWLEKRKFLAVGEIGTDLYWDKSFWEQQKEAFHSQCEMALHHNIPVVIHCRDSIHETIELVSKYKNEGLKGVFHCFTGTVDQGLKISEMGLYLGVGGVSTFKNGGLDKVIPHLDRSKIILETDAPYLAPTPHRGKRNEPAFILLVAEKIAQYLKMSLQELNDVTTKNANDLFFTN
ncbi:MAG: TatD family hydrolase [Bacteroidota bacterium]